MTIANADTLVGSIPVFGDALDFAYRSNLKDLRIFMKSRFAAGAVVFRWEASGRPKWARSDIHAAQQGDRR